MIAELRGVIALAVIALGLALAVVLDSVHEPAAVDRAVLAHLETSPTQLAWTRPRGPDVTVLRTANGQWTMVKPKAACDARAVETVLATLRGARWHRRGDRDRAGTIHATLTFGGHVIELGDPIHGADQAWIVVDGTAMLVDGWVARSLDPDPLALRDRTPLVDAAGAPAIVVRRPQHAPLELRGRPWRADQGVLAPEVIDPLLRALERVELVKLPDGPLEPLDPSATTISTEVTGALAIGGRCPGDPRLIGLASTAGDGCIDPPAWHDVEIALARLDGAPQDVVDPRPAGGSVVRIRIGTGVIDLAKRPMVTIDNLAHAADPDRVAELVAALGAPAKLVALPVQPAHGEIWVGFRDGGSITVHEVGATLARPDEHIAMQLDAPTRAILERPLEAYLDPTRWLEDPTAIASLVVDGVEVKRGAVLGEWTRGSAALPAADAALVDALAAAIAQVRAPAVEVPATWRPAHTITVAFAPPVGQPTSHVVELGSPAPNGCLARIDHVPGLAPLALCTAAQSLLLHAR